MSSDDECRAPGCRVSERHPSPVGVGGAPTSSRNKQASVTEPGAGVTTRQVLQASRSWNGTSYSGFPAGSPQLSVVRFSIPPRSSLPWHTHDVPSAAYVIDGALTVEDRETGRTHVVRAGEAFAESVGSVHRGYTEDLPAEVVTVYAGADGVPLSVPAR